MLDLEKIGDGSADLLCFVVARAPWLAHSLPGGFSNILDATLGTSASFWGQVARQQQNLRGEAIVDDVSSLAGERVSREKQRRRCGMKKIGGGGGEEEEERMAEAIPA